MRNPYIPRLEVFAMSFDKNERGSSDMDSDTDTYTDDHNPIDFKCGPYRIFITDQTRVLELFNPIKLKDFYTDLPFQDEELHDSSGSSAKREWGDSISGHNTGLPLTRQYEEEEEVEEEEEDDDSGSSRSSRDFISQPTDLPLTGPNGDIVPYDYFRVIVHKDTGIAEIDDSHLEQATPLYQYGSAAIPSDLVSSRHCVGVPLNDKPFDYKIRGPFGSSLTLKCIGFTSSWLVTVGVKWLMEGIGVDGKENHATETYICGKLSSYSSKYKDIRSVLLETPEYKAVKVAHGNSIPLLRSTVAIPFASSFTVEVSLRDPINNSAVEGRVTFDCDHSYENEDSVIYKSKDIVGSGAKAMIEVNVTVTEPDWAFGSMLYAS